MPAGDDFEEKLMTEFRQIASRLSEAQEAVNALKPKWQKINELIVAYGLQDEVAALMEGDDIATGSDATKSKGARIAETCERFFQENGNNWTRLSDIFTHLLSEGIVVGGKNPNSTLSAHLGAYDQFQVERSRGWRLKEMPLKQIEGE